VYGQNPAARRYAEALADAIRDLSDDQRTVVREHLEAFRDLVTGSPDVRNVMLNPSISSENRSAVLKSLLDRLDVTDIAQRFLLLVAERGRMEDLTDIVRAFGRIEDERLGRVRASVVSAEPLSKSTLNQIRKALEERLQRKVEIETGVDESLIGGVRTTVGSLVFDGTIATGLARLREQLEAADR
jgi:F-type H+-transporting ATPase subunit delta